MPLIAEPASAKIDGSLITEDDNSFGAYPILPISAMIEPPGFGTAYRITVSAPLVCSLSACALKFVSAVSYETAVAAGGVGFFCSGLAAARPPLSDATLW